MGIFREYDIRGIVEKDLTPDVVEKIGRAYATIASEQGVKTITIGRDGRLTSPTLCDQLITGFNGIWAECCEFGVMRNSLVIFLIVSL